MRAGTRSVSTRPHRRPSASLRVHPRIRVYPSAVKPHPCDNPRLMRQAVITRHGPPDVFEMRTAPDPVPGDGEIRLRVRAAGVNFADILARLGLYPDAPKPPVVVGYEVAGVVDAVGDAVTGFGHGDRVVAMTRFGGYADTVVVPAAHVFRVPEALSD